MTRRSWIDLALVAALGGAFGMLTVFIKPARAHDHYTHWLIPGSSVSCCSEKRSENGVVTGDCYVTVAEVRNGAWWARRDTGDWIAIPEKSLIRELNPDETGQAAHLCEVGGYVYCFRPPAGGS